MKIAILTALLDRANWPTGVPIYTRCLIKNLSLKDKIFLIHYQKSDSEIYGYKNIEEIIISPLPLPSPFKDFFTILFKLPKALKNKDIKLIHILAPTTMEVWALFLRNVKKVVTIHDLPHSHPRRFPISPWGIKKRIARRIRRYLYFVLKRKTDFFITVSENTKKDLIKYVGVEEGKIEVVYEASDKTLAQGERVDFPDFVTGPYVLGFRPEIEILEIFQELKKRDIKEKLVITGREEWIKKLREFVKKNDLEKDVIFPGFISKKDLIKAYAHARLFVFYTIHEGFGFPPLEAMACGCPVVASKVSSVPEIVGKGGVLLDNDDRDKWTETVFRILRDEGFRQNLISEGRAQAERFSWDKTTQETIEVYKKALR